MCHFDTFSFFAKKRCKFFKSAPLDQGTLKELPFYLYDQLMTSVNFDIVNIYSLFIQYTFDQNSKEDQINKTE